MAVYVERIPNARPDIPRLHGGGRVIEHDDKSRLYAYPATAEPLVSKRHYRSPVLGILDQGQLGSCEGNAGLGVMATEPYFSQVSALPSRRYAWNEDGAVQLYSDATKLDSLRGAYPPTDTGSTNLGIAKALLAAGYIGGYKTAFGLAATLAALCKTAVLLGVGWYSSFDTPDSTGRIIRTAGAYVVNGHAFVADEIDVERELVWGFQSWGRFGIGGRFCMAFSLLDQLLQERGDTMVFTPLAVPAPIPVPPVPPANADAVLWAACKTWAATKGLT